MLCYLIGGTQQLCTCGTQAEARCCCCFCTLLLLLLLTPPGVITEGELLHKARRAAAYTYLNNTLGIQAPLQPGTCGGGGAAAKGTAAKGAAAEIAAKSAADEARQSVGGGAVVRVLHQRQLGSAVHIFSHIRQVCVFDILFSSTGSTAWLVSSTAWLQPE